MAQDDPGPHLLTWATVIATVLASVAAASETITGHPTRPAWALVVVAAIAAILTLVALRLFDRGKLAAVRALTAAAVLVDLAFLWASDTDGFFLLFPTISLIYVAWTLVATVSAVATCALMVTLIAWHAGLPRGVIEGHGLGFVGGAAFVVAFVRIALAEQRARADVQRLAGAMEELAAARERNRIAREIHDGVGHALTAVHVHLETARTLAGHTPEANAVLAPIERAARGTREALDEVRRSVSMLRSSLGQGSLVSAVHALADESRLAGVAVDVRIEGEPRRLPPAVEFALFRVAQEGLTNVRRHASASRAVVALVFSADAAVVRVSDTGEGASLDETSGFGLVGIRERAALLGGTVEVRSAKGRGFELSVRVPA